LWPGFLRFWNSKRYTLGRQSPDGDLKGELKHMADDLEDIWDEVASDDTEVEPILDDVVDNPDEGADDDTDDSIDEIDDGDEADTDDESPVDDGPEFDWSEIVNRYGEQLVTLTVQGEEVQVPLKELPDGFMRREDYSRKTAEVAQERKAARWALDVQEAFASDPVGTLDAFAKAYNINLAAPTSAAPQVDPYEDFEPEVAEALRQRDQLLAQQAQRLEELSTRFSTVENDRIMAEVKAEVAELREEFGDDLDHVEMLRIAAEYNMPLREAAEHLVGKQYFARTRQQAHIDSDASRIGKAKDDEVRRSAKRRASGTATKKFDASAVAVEDFDDIGELFEINLNSITT
jgi:hypothetical protein